MVGKKIILFSISIFLIFIGLNFVFSDHVIQTNSGGTSFNVREDIGFVYNISVNNTDYDNAANITQVNFTIPNGFSINLGFNGTDALGSFTNTSNVLTWTNNTWLVNGTNATVLKYFWFNLTASNPGNYNITVTTSNGTGAFLSNISVSVNDTTAPSLIQLNNPTPANNSIVIGTLYVNLSVIDNGQISSITARLFNSSRDLINSSSSSSNFTASFTGLTGGSTYYFNATVNDTFGNSNSTVTRQIIFAETGFEFNGTVYDSIGVGLNNTVINITVSSMGNQGPTALGYYAATSNASGWFNITLPAYSSWMYKAVIRHTNSTTSAVDFVGPSVPDFPYQEFSMLRNVNFYLKQAGTINITAINSTGDRIAFNYQVKDTKLGYPISYSFSNGEPSLNEAIVYVPTDRNYSLMIYPSQSLPVSFNWNNFTSSNDYDINSLSSYNATTKTVKKQFNTTNNLVRITGYINATGINGWDEFKVVAFLLEPGNMVYLQYGILPYNMSAWNQQTDVYNLTTGYYNITVPGPAETQTLMLFATARNGSKYYGGFKNISVSYSTTASQYNFSTNQMLGMLGNPANLSVNNPTSTGSVNISCKKQTFNILNSTGSIFTGTAHIEATVDYSSYGAIEFTFMEDVSSNSGNFSIPLLNATGVKEFNVFVAQGAPKRLSKTADQIISNNNITISSFSPGDIGGALTSNQISISMYKSNSTCDVPSPDDSSCLVTSSGNLSTFNPLNAVIGGGAISFRMGTSSGILIHYANVDLLASGPPDGMFENDAGSTESTGSFSNAMKFGSNGPTMYDYILMSMPYVEGSTSTTGLNENSDINLSIPTFYDQDANGNMDWNTPIWSSSNGTNASAFAGNYSHFSAHANDWQTLMNPFNCTRTVSEFNSTRPCYIDTTNNRIWVRVPHFSGSSPSVTGGLITASSGTTNPGGDGSSGGFNRLTFTPDSNQLEQGYSASLKIGDRFKITISKELHYVTPNKINSNSVEINVTSTLQQATLSVNEEKKFDVNNDNSYDLAVKLNSIDSVNKKVDLTIRAESGKVTETDKNVDLASGEQTANQQEQKIELAETINYNYIIWLIFAIIVILILIIIWYLMKNKDIKNKTKIKYSFY